MPVSVLTWRDIQEHISRMTDAQKDMTACIGVHPSNVIPVFTLAATARDSAVSYLAGVRTCRACGCTETDCSGCMEINDDEPCSWVESDLCSVCAAASKVEPASVG